MKHITILQAKTLKESLSSIFKRHQDHRRLLPTGCVICVGTNRCKPLKAYASASVTESEAYASASVSRSGAYGNKLPANTYITISDDPSFHPELPRIYIRWADRLLDAYEIDGIYTEEELLSIAYMVTNVHIDMEEIHSRFNLEDKGNGKWKVTGWKWPDLRVV